MGRREAEIKCENADAMARKVLVDGRVRGAVVHGPRAAVHFDDERFGGGGPMETAQQRLPVHHPVSDILDRGQGRTSFFTSTGWRSMPTCRPARSKSSRSDALIWVE